MRHKLKVALLQSKMLYVQTKHFALALAILPLVLVVLLAYELSILMGKILRHLIQGKQSKSDVDYATLLAAERNIFRAENESCDLTQAWLAMFRVGKSQ